MAIVRLTGASCRRSLARSAASSSSSSSSLIGLQDNPQLGDEKGWYEFRGGNTSDGGATPVPLVFRDESRIPERSEAPSRCATSRVRELLVDSMGTSHARAAPPARPTPYVPPSCESCRPTRPDSPPQKRRR